MLLAVLLATVAVQSASTDPARSGAPPPVAIPAKMVDRNGDTVECRVQKVVGSHFYARYCLTAEQWRHLHDDSIQGLYGRTESHPNGTPNAEGMNPR